MHLWQYCPRRVQNLRIVPPWLLSVYLKTWTQCVREKACARHHSYNVNREHNTFADIIQHSTLTSRFHDTQSLPYTVNLTIDKVQSIKLIKVQPIPLGVSFSKVQSTNLEHLFVPRFSDKRSSSFELWVRNSIRKCQPKWDWLYNFGSIVNHQSTIMYFHHLTYSNILPNKLLLWPKSCK